MKKIYLLLLTILFAATTNAQLTGTKNIPGDYPTLAAAITDLNTQGVGAGGVTLNLLAGNPQTAPAGGYSVTATGILANQVTIQGNGNTITASAALTVGNLNDAIFKLIGSDYVTLTGFTMQENAANLVTAAATNNMTEWGVTLLYASLTDGAQNNTISNNTISLNRTYTNTFGIYSNVRHSATDVVTLADITNNTTAPNSNNKVYGNAVSNVNIGVVFIGSATAANMDNANDIGGASLATGNNFTNWGGAGATTAYQGLPTNLVLGAYLNDENNFNLSFNSFIGASWNTATGLRGILQDYAAVSVGTIINNINSNTVTMTQAGTGNFQVITTASTAGAISNVTMNMNSNNIINNAVTGAASAITIFGAANLGAFGTVNINNNIFTGNTSSATTGGFIAVTNQGAVVNTVNLNNNQVGTAAANAIAFSAATTAQTNTILNTNGAATATVNINNNTVQGLSFVITAQMSGVSNQAAAPIAINIKDNLLGTASRGYCTFSGVQTAPVLGVFNAAGSATGVVTITGNDIRGLNHTVTGTGAHTYIQNQTHTGSVTISNNTFTNITANTTGSITFIGNSVSRVAAAVSTVNNNSIVTAYNKTGAGGTILFYNSFGVSPTGTTEINSGNNFSNLTFTGATTITGWRSGDGTSVTGCTKTVTNNTFSNITVGTSAATILQVLTSNAATVTNNTISNIIAAGTLTAFTSSGNINLSQNTISGLSTTGTLVTAVSITGGTTNNVFKNKIYDIQANNAAGVVNGILVSASTTTNLFNNLIGDLKAPATSSATDAARGINLTSTTATSNLNVYYNTVYLNATSSGANFSTSGIFHTTSATATTAALDMRNNIIVNISTPNGTGLTAAYKRSSTTLTNFAATSDRNLFYAGTPGAARLIFNDGTNFDQTLAAYKARVAARDANSVTENPPFLSTTGSSATFLHINPAGGSLAQALGLPIAGMIDDFDADVRSVSTPDVGADEFTVCTGAVGGVAAVTGASSFCGSGTPVITASGYSAGVGSGYQWMSSTNSANYPASGTPVAGQTNPASLSTGVVSATTYYWLRATCPTGTATAYSNMITITINPSAASVTPSAPTICQGQSVTLTENGGTGTSWSWSPGGATTQSILVSPAATTTYTVTVTSPGGCIANANVTVNVNPVPAAVTASASSNAICLGASVNLFSSASATGSTILSQDFESGLGSWTMVNTSSGGTSPALVAWTLRPSGYVYNLETFSGGGGVQFVMANADLGGSGINANTTLTSPSFSTLGYTSLNLSFKHYYQHLTAAAAFVEVSTNSGSTWTTAQSYSAITGAATAFASASVDLSAYLGFPDVMVRFRYTAGWYWYWAVDDISITGTPAAFTYSWASTPAGFTSNLQNPTGVSPTVNTTYTVTVTGIGGCTSTANTTVAVNTPVVSGVVVQPTTCVTTNGSITLTITGGTGGVGPYSFAWTGPGVNPTSQNQVNLGVGSYTVTVTDVPSGCTNVQTYALPGPGACNICPTILTLTTNPTPEACANSNVVLTASGLANMGVTYGITFKQSTVALADPYVGGTVIATVPNGGLTSGGTVASTTTTFATSGNYFIYAILSPSPIDVACRPSATVNLTVNPTPTINAIPNQTLCQGQPTAPVNFTGTPAGVAYQWTNSNTQIGLAASGLGNIASFITTNPTLAPITGTITVTPVTGLNGPVVTNFNYTGALQSFTVPAGITSINIKAWGAQGNNNAGGIVGGLGGYAEGNLAVVPGQVLNVLVGGGATSSINGGFNGGGAAGVNGGCAAAQGGGGGGSSDIRTAPYALANRVIVGAGGGGAGGNRTAGCGRGAGGGGGGGLYGGGGGAGWPGIPGSDGPVPTGGTQAAGGAGGITTFSPGPTNGLPGALGVGGAGGTEIGSAQGTPTGPAEQGGIGGGLTGGSGLYNNANNWNGQSGAGGSSYIGGVSAGITTPGLRTGNGLVTITYTPPSATTCFGTPRTFTITVNPNPSIFITAIPGTTLCQGDPALLTVVTGVGTPIGTLYTQTGTPVGSPNSQAFEPANVAFNNQAAEDFVVPAGATWTISQISASGLYFNGVGPSTSFNVFFYNNAATNIPGTLIASYTNLPYTGGANPVITVPNTVLSAGTYWVSIQSNMSFVAGGQWAWGAAGVATIGNPWAWQNPNGGFGACPTWGPGSTTCVPGTGINLLFTLTGTSIIGGGPLPPGYTFLWSPAAGLSSTTTNPVAASPATTTTYTVNVNTAQGCTNTASILMTVNLRPTITSQPASRTNCVGSTATFTVTGTGTNLAYQWQESTTGCAGPWTNLTNVAPYSGVNSATLNVFPVALAMNNSQYRCVLTGICAPVGTANISGCAVLTVNPLPTVTVTPTVSCGSTTGNCTAITASGANTYVWTPATGLFLDCAATIPYVAGSNAATVYARPTAFTVYTVTGSLTATGCNSTATAFVNYTPPAPTVTPSAVAMCLGDAAVRLVSSSSTSTSVNFSSGPISVIVPDANLAGSSSNITVSGIPAACNVSGIAVTWNMPHAWDGDVAIVLKSPNGAILNLDYFLSGTGAGPTTGFVNTTVSSTGTAALGSGTSPFTGTFRADASIGTGGFGPSGPTAFAPTVTTWAPLYANPNGVWTLAMYDGFGGDQGTLTSWSINLTYVCGVPSTPAVWTPNGVGSGLFTDPAATIVYTGTPTDTVYTRPTPSGVYNYQATVQSLGGPASEITTTFANNNAFGLVIFNFKNNNPFPVNITGIESIASTSGASVATLYYKTTPIAGPPGAISAANGWLPAGTGNYTAIANTTTTIPQVFLSGLSLTIPAGATYGLGVESKTAANVGNLRYSTVAAGIYTISANGCDLITGTNIGFAGDIAPATLLNTPRGFIGIVRFGSNASVCTSPARTVVVTVNSPTTITTQPASVAVCTDKVATFTVVAGGSGPFNYQWQVSTNGGNTYTNIANGGVYSGATTATLTITAPPVSMNNNQYRVVITGAAPCASANSFQAKLTVNPLPTIVISASPYTSLFPGLRTTLSSTVSPFAAQSYAWLRNGTPVAGAFSATLGVGVDGLGDYTLRVTDVNGCTNTSNLITIKDSVNGKCFIYPNPNNGQFQVRYYSVANSVLPRTLTVYDAKGSRIMTQYYTIGRPYDRMDVDMRKYGKGLYWVEIGDMNGNRLTMCRLVIE